MIAIDLHVCLKKEQTATPEKLKIPANFSSLFWEFLLLTAATESWPISLYPACIMGRIHFDPDWCHWNCLKIKK